MQTKMSKAFEEIFSTINSLLAASCPKYGKLFIDESDLGIDTAKGAWLISRGVEERLVMVAHSS